MNIVIVDDDKSMRAVLRAIFEAAGHQVIREFVAGEGVVEFVAAQAPDVVCLDFNLPGANGLQLLVAIDTTSNPVDVIMITGSDDAELKGHSADLGARGFIHKPFDPSDVLAEIKAIEASRCIVQKAALTSEETSALMPAQATEITPGTAIIIDDSGAVRLLLKGILEEMKIKVTATVSTGHEGIEMVRRQRPSLICLDVEMPGMSGIEALPEIRAASPQSAVVMITGQASRPVVEAAIAGGAKGYLLKPIRPAKVEEFVRKLLRQPGASL